jgi:teichuronic acid biosynthesis glycosyltransferase TuaC
VFYRTQANALVQSGVDVTVVAPTPWAPWPLTRLSRRWAVHAASPVRAREGAIPVIRPRYPNVPGEPSWALPDRMISLATWRVRQDWAGAGLVHGHYAITGIAAHRVAQRAGLPLVLTFHGSDINVWPEEHRDRATDLLAAVRAASAVIAVSAALAQRVHSLTGVDALPIPLGSDLTSLEAGAQPRAAARRSLDLPQDRPVALFVGHLKRAKGVRLFVDGVLASGSDFIGLLVGDGPERGYGLSAEGAAGRVVYAGAQPHARIPVYLSAADVLVLPSSSEGLPTVIVEAGALGVPVIASDVGGVPELLGDDRGLVLEDFSSKAVAAGLREVRANPDAAQERAGRLSRHVLANYSAEANAGRLAEVYRSVIHGQ